MNIRVLSSLHFFIFDMIIEQIIKNYALLFLNEENINIKIL